ncbi:hypothetical protein ARMGADRAFT_1047109 [Armillaria gallica]|uniref:ATP-dependent DNA helicase n=1 Tax=Armillaria gallica TaxID=47427 RepID=A0A2H3D2K7_ARMGA|nr:hypothetical protein ARMGADRAFT_1047109 [Armillaria gallica]
MFFTGAARTGKSLLLQAVIRALHQKYFKQPGSVAITASTGMAMSSIRGLTLHSWGAISPTSFDVNYHLKHIRHSKPVLQCWQMAKVLVINEDFFQLPPVSKKDKEPQFAFETWAWKHTLDHCINLVEVFRQKDPGNLNVAFIQALNSLCIGQPSTEAITLFNSLSRPLLLSSDSLSVMPTELFPLRKNVAEANLTHLMDLKSQIFKYVATDSGSHKLLLDSLLVEQSITLRLDAQVMLIKNVNESLVNGLVGTVIGFYHCWEFQYGSAATEDGVLRTEAILVKREEFRINGSESVVLAKRAQL